MSDLEGQCVGLPGGGVACFAEYGDPAGRPLLFFHGWPSSRLQGRLCDRAARELGWRVISPDRPGVGGSPFQPGRRLGDAVPWAAGLLDALGIGEPVALLGFSGGAPYVYALLHGIPERVGAATVVSGAVPLAEFPDRADLMPLYRAMLAIKPRAPWLLGAVFAAGGRMATWPGARPFLNLCAQTLPPPDRLAVREPLMRDSVLEGLREAVRQGSRAAIADAEIYVGDWGFALEDVARPVTLWHGERDTNIPVRMAREVARRLPACEARWFPDEGHYSLPVRRVREVLSTLVR
jgi:pimeloyl-ACP methyl ester carboxylesterase